LDVLGLVKAIRDLQPKMPEPPDQMAFLERAQKILAPQTNAAAVDDLTRFEKFLSVADRLAGWRGGTGGRSGWDTALDFTKELAPTVIQPLMGIINNALLLRSQAKGAPAGAAPLSFAASPVAFDPYANPSAAAAYAQTLRNQPAGPAPTSAPASAASPGVPPATAAPQNMPAGSVSNGNGQPASELMGLLQAYGGVVVNSLNTGSRGCDFAQWLADGFGTATHAMIAQQGEVALVQSMMATPELAMFGEARLKRFAAEFINYEQILDAENEETIEEENEAASRA